MNELIRWVMGGILDGKIFADSVILLSQRHDAGYASARME